MRILFVTPYPPSRIRVRSYGFLTHLHPAHEVTIVTQCASERELGDARALQERGFEVVVVPESKQLALLRSGVALLRPLPLQVAYARSARFLRAVQRLCQRRRFDVVHVEHLRGIASVEPIAAALPLVWDAVDCITLLCGQTIAAGPNLPTRAVAAVEYPRTRRYEARVLGKLPHVLVTSHRDRAAMLGLRRMRVTDPLAQDQETLAAGIDVLPNGVDLHYFHPEQRERRRLNLVFSGKMSYHANVAAALYLSRQIMPLVWERQPGATLTIVGSDPPQSIRGLRRDPRVEVTGYVEDIRPYIWSAQVMLSPMVYSVGVQNKVLESMALGTPVVAAAQAASALGVTAGRDLLEARSAREFADAALHLMDDAALHSSLSRCGREYVEQKHDWREITERLVDAYDRAITARAGGDARGGARQDRLGEMQRSVLR